MTQLPRQVLDSVVAVGTKSPENNPDWVPDATGFFYGHAIYEHNILVAHDVYLVTARHVFLGPLGQRKCVYLSVNGAAWGVGISGRLNLVESGNQTWTGSTTVDLAIIRVGLKQFNDNGGQVRFLAEESCCKVSRDSSDLEGQRVLVVGYPMLLPQPSTRQYPMVRRGVIASIRAFCEGNSPTVLVDSQIFPGNSGGPVLLWPSPFTSDGPCTTGKMVCIGVVSGLWNTRANGALESSALAEIATLSTIDSLIEEHIKHWGAASFKEPPQATIEVLDE